MKIVLLGANGQLGQTFLQDGNLATLGNVIPVTRDGNVLGIGYGEPGDLSDQQAIVNLLERIQPDIIVNAAAYTAVDRAEQEEVLATRINGDAVDVVGAWAAKHDALVVHYSTDYVFDGASAMPYAVDAGTGPVGAYGRSKLAGENALRASGAQHMMFRTAWVYAPHGQNFLRTMLRLGAERDELRVVADQHGAPTSTQLIVDGTLAALRKWKQTLPGDRTELQGTHHLVASGHTTWHGFADAIFDAALRKELIARKPRVTAISTAEFPTLAQRPVYSVLDNSRFQQIFAFTLPDWRHGLDDVIDELSSGTR
ncbi:dTDP-4-dehydrorhamnose reductase [Dyella terrae]|uniref:dTDP-4-dehydrorhamnose reductase n=1 Tax=Dyella terrae TaxID=522259 RepID=UPI001EFD7CC4|nr:dTDP-4-dehydrorhamnose reductase [Dyella terrae]ULU25217.1 dTDP-4-dehydrorhamnose reductase [Dyella terrae]